MNPKLDSERVKEIFEQAIDLGSQEERRGYVEGACDGDAEMQARVQTLLRAHFEGEDAFLPDRPRPPPASLSPPAALEGRPGTVIGRYKLLQEIGEGGCGVVWMAEQAEPVRRRVALKVIKLGMDTKSVIARFEAERQALAMMDHPNIARVLDAGATDAGRPYFVMELVRGVRLTRYCEQHKLPVCERLDLFIKVCQAIQHAHQKGVIHRDIKPSNILVTLHDGTPVPKVIDFGIAKATDQRLTDKTLFTQYDSFIGTPAYMSPEQAEMSGLDIDTRTDIYSLGVLLYELLTGVTPFDAQTLAKSGLDEMRRIIREDEPKRPSTRLISMGEVGATGTLRPGRAKRPALAALVRGDLDWIVMKCLEKDRTRRYETASGLAADLRRHLNHEAVVARPASAAYRMQKAIRRYRLAFGAATAVVLALVTGMVIALWQAERAVRAEAAAKKAEAATRDELENARGALAFIRDDLLGQASPDRQPDPNLTVRTLLNRTSARLHHSANLPPRLEADLRQAIGSLHFELGEYALAIGHLDRAITLQRQHLGPAHEDTLRTLHTLGETHWWNGDDGKSLELAREGLDLSRRALGETSLLTLQFRFITALASVYTEPGPTEEIDRGIRETLRVIRASLGETHKLTFRVEVVLGAHLSDRGKFAEAEALLSRALERQRSVLPETDQLMIQAASMLARVNANQAVRGLADFAVAETMNRRILALRQSINGPNHAMTVNIEIQLAMIHLKRNEFAEAEKIRLRLMELLAEGRLVESRLVVRSLVDLTRLYRYLQEWGKVDELANAVRAAGRKQFKDEALPFQLAAIDDEWGRGLMTQERFAEAEPHFRRAVEIRTQRHNTHGRRFAAMSRLGECLFKQNQDLAEAEELLKTAADELNKRFKQLPDYIRLEIAGSAQRRMADFYAGTGRPDEAAVYREILSRLERAEGRRLEADDLFLLF
jgi:tetratricopeptide (TPR) repeat protein